MANKPTGVPARRGLALLLAAGLGAAALWCLTPPAHARDAVDAARASSPAATPTSPAVRAARPAWSELTPTQQRVLAPLAGQWNTLTEVHRRKWLRIAARFEELAPAEQQRVHARMTEWAKLTPEQRRLARENFQIHRTVPVERKTEAWDRYQQLPEAQKRQLAEAAKVPPRPGAVSALPSSRKPPISTTPARTVPHASSAASAPPAAASAAAVLSASAALAPGAAPASGAPGSVPASATLPFDAASGTAAASAPVTDTAPAANADTFSRGN
ncbi:DUF3106 domain-containing protein [Cupriavidus gilardii]|uniref:DUF3106 domain-containing protein n=1 Tax=Cupriavidus gilardii TaxID=82541 RepID=UPI001ABE3023|nr:DUF3106 domain-containing protein [Cupriavidus gilardii]MBO4119993.1 DUF3106 domain-containing protein [Cupriavidus gilardii]